MVGVGVGAGAEGRMKAAVEVRLSILGLNVWKDARICVVEYLTGATTLTVGPNPVGGQEVLNLGSATKRAFLRV